MIYLRKSHLLASVVSGLSAINLKTENILVFQGIINYFTPLTSCLENLSYLSQISPSLSFVDSSLFSCSFYPNFSLGDGAIALFPLMIYSYDNLPKLGKELDKIRDGFLGLDVNINTWKILGVVVGLIIEEKINLRENEVIIRKKLREFGSDEIEINNLLLIEELKEKNYSLEKVSEILIEKVEDKNLAIYQGLYCFFSYPHNLEVSLNRSCQFTTETTTTKVLTGLLLGLFNGYSSIPLSWQQRNIVYNGEKIEKIVTRFVDTWAGVLSFQH